MDYHSRPGVLELRAVSPWKHNDSSVGIRRAEL